MASERKKAILPLLISISITAVIVLCGVLIFYLKVAIYGGPVPTFGGVDLSKVEVGMSLEQVEEVLGGAADEAFIGDTGWTSYGYTTGITGTEFTPHERSDFVIFKDGKVYSVISKDQSKNHNWPDLITSTERVVGIPISK